MKKKSFFVGAGALLLMASMNLGHALNEYGFLSGNLCGRILAQTTTTGGNSSTGGSSSTGGGSSSTGGGSSSTGGSGSTGGGSTSGISDGYLKNKHEVPVSTGTEKKDEPVFSDDNTIIGKVTFEITSYKVRCDDGSDKCYFNKTWSEREIISSGTISK